MAKKYYIKKVHGNHIEYKRYKCTDGWSRDKIYCWKFSKQGAEKIVERLRLSVHSSRRNEFEFSIEEACDSL